MDFSVIRPKPPTKKPEGPPAPPPPAGGASAPKPPPPPQPQARPWPYVEEFDRISQIQRAQSIEYTNARTWRLNFGDNSDHYSDKGINCEYNHQYYPHNYEGYNNYMHDPCHHMLLGGPGPLQLTGPSHLARLPPPVDYGHHALLGPPLPGPTPALPPPGYHHGPPRLPPAPYNYPPPPYDGGFFSDENPHGCMIM